MHHDTENVFEFVRNKSYIPHTFCMEARRKAINNRSSSGSKGGYRLRQEVVTASWRYHYVFIPLLWQCSCLHIIYVVQCVCYISFLGSNRKPAASILSASDDIFFQLFGFYNWITETTIIVVCWWSCSRCLPHREKAWLYCMCVIV